MHKFTDLPAAVIFHRGFVYVICVQVSKECQEIFKKQVENMLDTYKREVDTFESIIMAQMDNESKLIHEIQNLKEK